MPDNTDATYLNQFIFLTFPMTDLLILQDAPSFADTVFKAYGFSFMSVCPSQIVSPYLPPVSVIVLPAGFGNPDYSGTAGLFSSGISPEIRAGARPENHPETCPENHPETCSGKRSGISVRLSRFARAGGTVLFFSPLKDRFDPSVLGFQEEGLSGFYRQKEIIRPGNRSFTDSETVFCDGFFEVPGKSGEEITYLEKKAGKGCVIATTIHEVMSKEFFMKLIRPEKYRL